MLKTITSRLPKYGFKLTKFGQISLTKLNVCHLRNNYNCFNYSTCFIKDLSVQQKMDHFQNTVQQLNSIIEKLQTNIGGEVKSQQVKQCQTKSVQDKPVQTKSVQDKPAQDKPVQTKPAQDKPVQTKQAQVKPAQVKPAQDKPVQTKQAQVNPAQVKPAQVKLVQTKPAQDKPVQTKQAQVNPAQVKPAQVKPAQDKAAQAQAQAPKKEQKKEDKKQDKKAKQAKNKQAKNKQKKQVQKKEPQQDGPKQVDPKFFAQIDIRIGDIVQCWKHPQSENLFCQKINIGKQVRQIASGLQKFVAHQNMKGPVLVMVNLKPRPLAGFPSNGMVVCASTPDHNNVQLLIPEGEIGEKVYLEGHQDLFAGEDILPVLNPKRKVVQKCLQHFKTDAEGFVIWQGIRLRTKAGFIKAATIKNGNVG